MRPPGTYLSGPPNICLPATPLLQRKAKHFVEKQILSQILLHTPEQFIMGQIGKYTTHTHDILQVYCILLFETSSQQKNPYRILDSVVVHQQYETSKGGNQIWQKKIRAMTLEP